MRILYVCQDAGIPVFGRKGASTHIREVIRAWEGMGHEMHLACVDLGPDHDSATAPPVTTVQPLRARILGADVRRALTNHRFGRALPVVARSFGPDLVYERHSLYTGAATQLARRLGIPHVLEANALLSDEQRDRLHHPQWAARRERREFLRTDCLITVSPGLADACRRMGVPPAKVHTLPMAVDPQHFAPRPRDLAVRARWGWDAGHTVVGYLGALTGWHRPDLLLRAVARIADDQPTLRLLSIGGSPHHVDRYRALADELGLAERVVFTGAIPYHEVPDVLAEVDVGVVPGAHQWSTPTKIFEYGAMGIPCVAPATRNIAAVIDDGETGSLFEPDGERALADTLLRLLSDPSMTRRVGEAGRRRVLERHTWSHHAGELIRLCQELVADRRRVKSEV